RGTSEVDRQPSIAEGDARDPTRTSNCRGAAPAEIRNVPFPPLELGFAIHRPAVDRTRRRGRNMINVEEFKARLRGSLLHPGEDGYDQARKIWNGMFDTTQALVAR